MILYVKIPYMQQQFNSLLVLDVVISKIMPNLKKVKSTSQITKYKKSYRKSFW